MSNKKTILDEDKVDAPEAKEAPAPKAKPKPTLTEMRESSRKQAEHARKEAEKKAGK